jgi:hypothetical protein
VTNLINQPWYIVVSHGGNGVPQRSVVAAWGSWERQLPSAMRERTNANNVENARNHFGAKLVEATTRRAALAADNSLERGVCGRGEWCRSTNTADRDDDA